MINPRASTTSPRARDVLCRALGSELKVDVAETHRRGHAVELARTAAVDGVDLVVAFGGDGTVNEVVNGVLADRADPTPALAVVPAGNANVFARTLGLPTDPVEATAELIEALRQGRRRRIGLGRAGERWFTFCAGVGFDAEVVREVEGQRGTDRPATPALYVRTALRHFFTASDRRHPTIRLHEPGCDPVGGLFLLIVSNSSPWTYLGARPVRPNPEASFDTGLDLLAMRRFGTVAMLNVIRRMLSSSSGPPRGRAVLRRHDLREFAVRAARPLAIQVDGEYVGEAEELRFRFVRHALEVIS